MLQAKRRELPGLFKVHSIEAVGLDDCDCTPELFRSDSDCLSPRFHAPQCTISPDARRPPPTIGRKRRRLPPGRGTGGVPLS
jgi:hypothetical protein